MCKILSWMERKAGLTNGELSKTSHKGMKRFDHAGLNLLSVSWKKTACLIKVKKMLIKVKSWVFFCDALHHVLEKCKVFPLSVFCLAACVMQSLTRGWKQ